MEQQNKENIQNIINTVVPAVQQTKQNNTLVIILSVLLLISMSVSGFFAYQTQTLVKELTVLRTTQPTSIVTVTPTEMPILDSYPNSSPISNNTGRISGKLCYPSEYLPHGKIVAKNIKNSNIIEKEYLGSQKGANENFFIDVPNGTYNVRYQAYPTGSTEFTSLYYTPCAKNNEYNFCQSLDNHKLISITVNNNEFEDVMLCDMGLSKQQEDLLNSSF